MPVFPRFLAALLLPLLPLASFADGPVPAEEDVRSAVRDLGDERPEVREEARGVLLRWGAEHPDDVLRMLPETSDDPEVKEALLALRERIRELERMGKRLARSLEAVKGNGPLAEATEALLKKMGDDEFLAPAAADPVRLPETDEVLTPYIIASGEDKPKAMAVMRVLLADRVLAVRRIAVRVLYYHGTMADAADVREALKDEDAYVRGAAAQALAKYGDKESIEPIMTMLKDNDPVVRYHAILSLSQLGAGAATDDIIKLLTDADARVRVLALLALDRGGVKSAAAEIVKFLDDHDPAVRHAACTAMEHFAGLKWDPEEARRREIRKWWEEHKDDPEMKKR